MAVAGVERNGVMQIAWLVPDLAAAAEAWRATTVSARSFTPPTLRSMIFSIGEVPRQSIFRSRLHRPVGSRSNWCSSIAIVHRRTVICSADRLTGFIMSVFIATIMMPNWRAIVHKGSKCLSRVGWEAGGLLTSIRQRRSAAWSN